MKTPFDTRVEILTLTKHFYEDEPDLNLDEFLDEFNSEFMLATNIWHKQCVPTDKGIATINRTFDALIAEFGMNEDKGWKNFKEFISK